jgi:gamma-glutamylcyclotransferase (GGCT)/AIG2-like uncharacterized protein YtfP
MPKKEQQPNGGLVFVYGSLKHGFWLHHILESNGAKFLSEAITKKASYALATANDAWPGIVGGGKHHIKGEVYRVSRDCLAILDEAEGVMEDGSGLFDRVGMKIKNYKGFMHCYVAAQRLAKLLDKDAKSDCIRTYSGVQEWVHPDARS